MFRKDLTYHDIPFSCETPQEDFIINGGVSDLYIRCESNRNNIIRIRTVGILSNTNGRFYIKQMNITHNPSTAPDPRQCIQVSMAHMNKIVSCPSMPYAVQLFGRLQWCNRPVIFAQIVQPLNASVAILLQETLARVPTIQSHSHSHPIDNMELYD